MKSPQDTFTEYLENFLTGQPASVSDPGVEYPPEPDMGDLASTYALQAANENDDNPRDIASTLVDYLQDEGEVFESVSVEGPGFVNVTFTDEYLINLIKDYLDRPDLQYKNLGSDETVLLEFVSANPTGPLHVGHGRGAVYGDALGRLLEAHGYDVHREYYVNDTGEQIRKLAESLNFRAREEAGETVTFTDDHYQGDYVKEIVAEENITPETELGNCASRGIENILERIFDDLDRCDIHFDEVTYESEVAPREELNELVERLREQGYVENRDGAVFLLTSRQGDDKDRVLIKDDDTPTYFANDLVYHHKKYQRGFDRLIDVWGHDHHGYQDRLRVGLEFLGHDLDRFEIELYQLVDLYRGGEPVSMSTRQGDFEPLADLVEEVGVDAVRFNFLTKNNDRPLDFDIEVATSEDEENPVYYVQYAHTRMAGILREAPDSLTDGPMAEELSDEGHKLLLKSLNYQYHLLEATRSRDPHRITHYLIEIARKFHSYYTDHRVIDEDNPERSRLRLLLVRYLKKLFKTVLNLLGVSAPERM